jgi:anti-sigma factor RsiW
MTQLSDEHLLIYLQQSLTAAQSDELEQELLRSPEWATRLLHLRQGDLPYTAAFAQEALPETSVQLSDKVKHWCQLSANPKRTPPQKASQANRWRQLWIGGPWQFDTSAFGGIRRLSSAVAVFAIGISVGLVGSSLHQASVSPAPWEQAVAHYQRLYQRETVASLRYDPVDSARVLDQAAQRYGLKIAIPDFSQQGLELKRVQMLGLLGKPIIQIVYLPKNGSPIALCITTASAQPMTSSPGLDATDDYLGQRLLSWRYAGAAYLLIGEHSPQQLQQLQRLMPAPI